MIGRTISAFRWMTEEELAARGWEGCPTLVFVLDDGTKIYPSADKEGNRPGEFFGVDPRGRLIKLCGPLG